MICVDVTRLRGKIAESGVPFDSIAEKMGISRSTLYRKLKNSGKSMLIRDANNLVSILNLSESEAMSIFFAREVA